MPVIVWIISDSNIKLYVADINTGGLGIPNINIFGCDDIAGHVIFSSNFTEDCDVFYLYALHEIGHALGLGHCSSRTIMGSAVRTSAFTGLQPGDIEGIKQIYGEK